MIFNLNIDPKYCRVQRKDGDFNWCPVLNRVVDECEKYNTVLSFDYDAVEHRRCGKCKADEKKEAKNAKV